MYFVEFVVMVFVVAVAVIIIVMLVGVLVLITIIIAIKRGEMNITKTKRFNWPRSPSSDKYFLTLIFFLSGLGQG